MRLYFSPGYIIYTLSFINATLYYIFYHCNADTLPVSGRKLTASVLELVINSTSYFSFLINVILYKKCSLISNALSQLPNFKGSVVCAKLVAKHKNSLKYLAYTVPELVLLVSNEKRFKVLWQINLCMVILKNFHTYTLWKLHYHFKCSLRSMQSLFCNLYIVVECSVNPVVTSLLGNSTTTDIASLSLGFPWSSGRSRFVTELWRLPCKTEVKVDW